MDDPQKPADQPVSEAEPVETPPVETPAPAEPTAPPQEQPAPVAAAPVLPPEASSRKKLSKLFLILAAVFLLAAAGLGAWYLTKDKDEPASADQSQTETEQTVEDTSAEIEMKNTVFTSAFAGASTVEVTHPASWEVKESVDDFDDGYKLNLMAIGSEAGHWLHLFDVEGVGGACDPDTKPYTLVKRLPTATEGVFFSEYQAEGRPQLLELENFSTSEATDEHKQLKEGESGIGVCRNLFFYPSVFSGTFADISDRVDRQEQGALTFSSIESDTEFVKMLQSLKITDNTVQE